jgi:hypothetical protein
VPAKKPRTLSRPIRYLLSADRRLRTLSMRKLAPSPKKAKRAAAPARKRAGARPNRRPATRQIERPSPWIPGSDFAAVGVIAVIATVVLVASRQPTPEAPSTVVAATMTAQPSPSPSPAKARVQSPVQVEPPPAVKPVKAPALPAPPTQMVSLDQPRRAPAASIVRTVDVKPAPEAPASYATAEPAMTVPAAAPATPDRVTGCLESDGGTFRLTDTSGEDAPKSRSWRWGLMRKRSVPVVLTDAAHTLNLPRHVGQRVTAAGTLVDREMQARSLKSLGSCD